MSQASAGFSRGIRRREGAEVKSATGGTERFAMDPATHAIKAASDERLGHVSGGYFCVEKTTVAARTAIRGEFQVAMQDLFEAAVGVGFPYGTASALGTFMKVGLAPNGKSQSHTPDFVVRELGLRTVAARKATHMRNLCQ
jgi:hypothetical protein